MAMVKSFCIVSLMDKGSGTKLFVDYNVRGLPEHIRKEWSETQDRNGNILKEFVVFSGTASIQVGPCGPWKPGE